MQVSETGIALIKHFEGFAAKPYRCPAGKLTAGYGHVLLPGEEGHCPLSEQEADKLLRWDLKAIEKQLGRFFGGKLTQEQWDAVCCLAYNIGVGALRKSTLSRKIKAGDMLGAVGEFERWIFAGGRVLPGLVRRRRAEKQLFMTGSWQVD